jgi:hypothetical protein
MTLNSALSTRESFSFELPQGCRECGLSDESLPVEVADAAELAKSEMAPFRLRRLFVIALSSMCFDGQAGIRAIRSRNDQKSN